LKVEIDPVWWYEAGYADQEQLIFHELAHCVLRQDHRNFIMSDRCPGSIMDEYHIHNSCYIKHYDYYIEELFGD